MPRPKSRPEPFVYDIENDCKMPMIGHPTEWCLGCKWHEPKFVATDLSGRKCARVYADLGGMHLDDIAKIWGLTRERIRQLEEHALFKIQRFITLRRPSVGKAMVNHAQEVLDIQDPKALLSAIHDYIAATTYPARSGHERPYRSTDAPMPVPLEKVPENGLELVTWRNERGISQLTLAKAIGVCKNTIWNAEIDPRKALTDNVSDRIGKYMKDERKTNGT